jgi:quaternary ammonium compound-resistance protein SugE
VFLVLSGLLQIGWLVSLRETRGFTRVVPMLCWALFGLGSTLLFSRSLERIPMSTAYAVWTAISVVGSVAVDMIVLRQPGSLRLVYILVILAATTGLKLSEAPR